MSDNEVLIIFGTETGNAEALADDAKGFAKDYGLEGNGVFMAVINVAYNSAAKLLLICGSYWGPGPQTTNSAPPYETACESEDGCMEGVNFAVLALGDTDYEFFCESGKEWDSLIEQKGGTRINDRIDCDVDYEDDDECEEWIKTTLEKFSNL